MKRNLSEWPQSISVSTTIFPRLWLKWHMVTWWSMKTSVASSLFNPEQTSWELERETAVHRVCLTFSYQVLFWSNSPTVSFWGGRIYGDPMCFSYLPSALRKKWQKEKIIKNNHSPPDLLWVVKKKSRGTNHRVPQWHAAGALVISLPITRSIECIISEFYILPPLSRSIAGQGYH